MSIMDSKSDYREVYISKEDFDKLRSDRSFVKLLVLARVVNALYFCFSALLDYKNDLTPAGQRQSYNAFLFSSGALYEGLIVADTLEKHFGDRDSYSKGFGKLLKDAKTKEIRSTILERMRNSCVFHFSEGVARKTIKTLNLQSYIFATNVGRKRSGTYYNLADETVINFLLGDPSSPAEEERKFRSDTQSVTDLLAAFVDSADSLIGEVLAEGSWKMRVKKDHPKNKLKASAHPTKLCG
jgi:hypothetical protein